MRRLAVTLLTVAFLMIPPAAEAQTDSPVVWVWGLTHAVMVTNGAPDHPTLMQTLHDVTAATSGGNFALFLERDGTVRGWGLNNVGQLGDGSQTDRDTPVQVSGLTDVVAIAGGTTSGTALKRDGTVWDWGQGVMGDGKEKRTQLTPVQVSNLSGVTGIAQGPPGSLALKSDGTVWIWNGGQGLMEIATLEALTQQHHLDGPVAPLQVPGLTGITAISVGGQFALALRNDGTVLAWGANGHGQLGQNASTDLQNRNTPVPVKGVSGVTAIAAGSDHALALKSDGTVWGWGDNALGVLGDGTLEGGSSAHPTPQPIAALTGITAIAAGPGFSLVLKSDHSVWAWGYNGYGTLGDGSRARHSYELLPVPVPGLPNSAVSIFAGNGGSEGFAITAPPPKPAAVAAPAPTVVPTATPPDTSPSPNAPADVSPANPAPTEAAVPATSDVPSALTEAVRSDILAAVDRANAAWNHATETLDASGLSDTVAGQLLESDLAEVNQLSEQGHTKHYTARAFTVVSVSLDTPGHAEVQTQETWSAALHDAASGALVQSLPATDYAETYTVDYLNDGWIATADVIQ